jgi:hypothetical protein
MRCKALGLVPMQVLTPTTKDPTVTKILTTLAVLALTLGALAGTASAANGSCMTQREFSALHKGQTLTRVAAIVGSRGHVEASSTAGSYEPRCALGRRAPRTVLRRRRS